MSSRPRRSAAARANQVISVHARWADSPERGEPSRMSSRRSGRASRDAPASPDDGSLTVKINPSRSSIRNGRTFTGGEIVEGKRNRGGRKSYVVDSSPDEDDEEEEDDEEIEVDEDEDDDELDEDAEGEEMDVDAEGEDAEGDIDTDMIIPPAPIIKVSKPPKAKPAPRAAASRVIPDDEDDDDDDDLSDPADSDMGDADQTMAMDDTMLDEDAEGEEIEVAGEEVDEVEAPDSDDEGSQDGELDRSKMTKRQRARLGDEPTQYMKLSDEVQAKKVFTAEELSMRRQEMARRRRNLSEKRNEEVKMETINKLLKKQAPKISRKAAADGGEEASKHSPIFVRWVSNKSGVRVGVPGEIVKGPAGAVFGKSRPGLSSGKMVEEVA